jgi:hypothetical protein
MWDLIGNAMLVGMVPLVLYELVQEVRGMKGGLHDRYHE